jgi:O-antigen/teichoic acid export membrane protein
MLPIVGALGGVASSAVNVIFPYTAQLKANKNFKDINFIFFKSTKLFCVFLVPISLFIFVFSKSIFTLWMGEEIAEKSWLVLSLIGLSSFIGSFSAIPNLIILGLGNSRLIGVFSIIAIIFYSIFTPLFTYIWGIEGTAVALLLTSISLISYVIFKTTHFLNIKIYDYLIQTVYPHAFYILFAFILFSFNFFLDVNYLIWLIIGLILLIIHYAILLISNYSSLLQMFNIKNKTDVTISK